MESKQFLLEAETTSLALSIHALHSAQSADAADENRLSPVYRATRALCESFVRAFGDTLNVTQDVLTESEATAVASILTEAETLMGSLAKQITMHSGVDQYIALARGEVTLDALESDWDSHP